ncbi:hypothetical protein A1O3_09924 [Capronia epimyces CBS 606.96]|uniref:Uncharacterized protein n=1 Tax=Capronia epimyces CBS 606.96 TaxID=1182542 RepID=W9XK14_9EURO|nr:uncharacterized protein A1O3_09924 [Capronia epimyces CBS 606.96]EXJ77695.1 hypothetical protein A1O3_09924 [Capronia epimyces CBS 606.96]
MSFRGIQDRPWPPPALEGTPAFPTSTGASLTAAALQEVTSGPALSKHKSSTATKLSPGSSTKNVQTGLAMGQTPKGTSKIASSPVSRVGSLPSRQAYTGFLSSDSSAFVSSATKYFATFSNTQQAQQENTNVSSVVAAQETQPSTKDTSQQLPTAARDNDAIRKIPVSEFAFPVNAALAPPQMSTHTDGAPSPEALSGFSASAKSHAPLSGQSSIHEEQAQNSNAVTCDLIGLGIQDIDDGLAQKQADCSSPNNVAGLASDGGSIMDSPIIDNMNNDVLVAGKGKVVIINGIRYVPESDLLALKLSLTTAITKPDITINTDHVLESKDIVSAIASSSPPSKTQQSSASDPPSSSNISQSVVKANPFNPREPIVQGGAKIPILPSTTDNENQKDMEPLTLDQAIVAALRSERSTSSSIPIPSPAPVEAAAPVPPASNVSSKPRTSTSANAIISKWAPIAPSPDPSVTPSVGSVTVDERKNTSALQPKSTNGGSIHASSTQGVNSGPLPKPSGTLQPPVPTPGHLSTSPLIGDRRAFGHLSPLAAAGLQHASPPGRPAPKRKFHQPGPGYTLLLADLERSSARSTVQAGAPALEMSIPSQQSAAEDSDDSEL